MRRTKVISFLLALVLLISLSTTALAENTNSTAAGNSTAVQVTYSSYNDNSGDYHLSVQTPKTMTPLTQSGNTQSTIIVDPSITYQTFLGFGGTMLNADVWEFDRLSESDKMSALQALFDPVQGNNYSLLRITIGSCDADRSFDKTKRDNGYWTYDDMPLGETDPNLEHFSIQRDIDDGIVATVKQILDINPNIKIFASMWSPPAWMKDNESLIWGGSVLPEYYEALANYYVKYIQAYALQGIPIYAVTLQNEPQIVQGYPSTIWTAEQQADFAVILKNAFTANNISTKIWAFDDNSIHSFDFAEKVLLDEEANNSIDGLGFHNYDGLAMTTPSGLHYQYPDKTMHITEITNGAAKLVQYFRNWISSYSYWLTFAEFTNPVYDENGNWVTGGGPGPGYWQDVQTNDSPDFWTDTQVSWAGEYGNSTYRLNSWYYTFGQFSRFIQPGAVRIDSTDALYGGALTNVAFQNDDGTIVMVVVNRDVTTYNTTDINSPDRTITVVTPDGQFTDTIPGDTVATYRWVPTSGMCIDIDDCTAYATNTNGGYTAIQAVDGASETVWNSGANQGSGQSYVLDLGSLKNYDQISLNQSFIPDDYPASFRVFSSNDGTAWGTPIASGTGTFGFTTIEFPMQTSRYIKIELTSAANKGWTIGNVGLFNGNSGLLDRSGWTATASSTETGGSPQNALDGNYETRWSNGTAPSPGQWFMVDLGTAKHFNQILMSTGPSDGDYARGYEVFVSNDGNSWGSPIAQGVGSQQEVWVSFPDTNARFIKIVQTASVNNAWWSIAEFKVYNTVSVEAANTEVRLSNAGWVATASTSSYGQPSNAIDGKLETNWTTGAVQNGTEHFQIDMGSNQSFDMVELNSMPCFAGNLELVPCNSPTKYQVYVAPDGGDWTLVAEGYGNGLAVTRILLGEQTARYIHIKQTAPSTAGRWWTIGEINVLNTRN